MKRFAITLAVAAAALALTVPGASAAKFKFFKTPSGNIGCVMGGGARALRHQAKSWQAPPKPASCDVDWGFGVAVGRKHKANYVCAGDTVFDPGEPDSRLRRAAGQEPLPLHQQAEGHPLREHEEQARVLHVHERSVRLF